MSQAIQAFKVAPREGRVSRNPEEDERVMISTVAPREGRVSRNPAWRPRESTRQ